jgi:hypothetical protein
MEIEPHAKKASRMNAAGPTGMMNGGNLRAVVISRMASPSFKSLKQLHLFGP